MGRRTDRRTHRLTPPQHSVTGVLVRHQGPGGSGGWVCKGIPSRTQQALCQQPQQQHGQARRQQQQQRRGPHGCSAAARMQHLGDGVVWMQSTSCVCVTPIPPPKLSDRGLRGQSSLSLQRLTEAGLQPAVLHPVGQHPPLLLCHPFPPPPHTHRAAGTQSSVHGWCVHAWHVCSCAKGGTHGSACANCASTRVHTLTPSPTPLPAAVLTSPGCRGKGTAHTCANTHKVTPPRTPPQPHKPPLCAKMGPKMHLQG